MTKDYVVNLKNPEDSPEKIAQKLNTLTYAIDASVIRGAVPRSDFDEFKDKTNKYINGNKERLDTNDLRWHGSGLSRVTHDSTLSGDGTATSPLSVLETGLGTVTSVSVITANGISGSVTNPTTTPSITLDISGLDASKIADGSVSSVEFEYLGNVTSDIQAQINTKGSGTVTSVSGTSNRITSTGGTTPIIDISASFEALLGKVANPLSQFASTTSSQLLGVISDETGTGSLVFANKPTFIGTIQTIAAVAALALDGSLGNIFTKTIGTGSTFTQSNFSTGQSFMVTVSGAFTITWFSGITWFTSGATAPTQAALTTYGFTCTGSNTFNGYLVGTQ